MSDKATGEQMKLLSSIFWGLRFQASKAGAARRVAALSAQTVRFTAHEPKGLRDEMRTCIFNGLEIGPWAAFPSAFRVRRKGHEQRLDIEERPRAQGEDAHQSRTRGTRRFQVPLLVGDHQSGGRTSSRWT